MTETQEIKPPKPKFLSTSGSLVFSYRTAVGFVNAMHNFSLPGKKAVQMSRFKHIVNDYLEEITKERDKVLEKYCEMEEGKLKTIDDKGQVAFLPGKKKEANDAVEDLFNSTPLIFNLTSPKVKIAAEMVYGIMTGDDCPAIPQGWDAAAAVSAEELRIALDKKDE